MQGTNPKCPYCGTTCIDGMTTDKEGKVWVTYGCNNDICQKYCEYEIKVPMKTI